MHIYGFQKTTLLDYPGKLASLVFTGGCNFRCPYCQNGELVVDRGQAEPAREADVLDHLKKRSGIIEGLVISGGEPTLQADLIEFAERVKALGLAVKLDTNGTNPEVVETLIDRGFVDYIAMDIKQCPGKYPQTAGLQNAGESNAGEIGGTIGGSVTVIPREGVQERLTENVRRTADILLTGSVDYEFRTTFVDGLFEDSDFLAIADWIRGAKRYYIQPYRESEGVIAPDVCKTPDDVRLQRVLALLKERLPETEVVLRGYELPEPA